MYCSYWKSFTLNRTNNEYPHVLNVQVKTPCDGAEVNCGFGWIQLP